MGFFDKKLRLLKGRMFSRFDYYGPASTKESMKEFGLAPAESAREYFGWTEEDDRDGINKLIERKRRILKERVANGCNLREEMELEIEINGLSNYLD